MNGKGILWSLASSCRTACKKLKNYIAAHNSFDNKDSKPRWTVGHSEYVKVHLKTKISGTLICNKSPS